MHAFTPPFSMSLHAGFRADASRLSVEPLTEVLGVRLELEDDLELGGAYYSYAPYPLPDSGLTGVRLRVNEIPGLGRTYDARPDLLSVLSIELCNSNLLDLGRLELQLRKAYGDLFDVAEYVVVSAPPADNPSFSPKVHSVQFEASARGRGTPIGEPPILNCSMELDLADDDQALARDTIAGMTNSAEVLRGVNSIRIGHGRARLTLQFDLPSLLELGAYAQAVESAACSTVKTLGYSIFGDLCRDGRMVRIERAFSSPAEALPSWRRR